LPIHSCEIWPKPILKNCQNPRGQCCQIFIRTTYQNGENVPKLAAEIPNAYKKYPNWHFFHENKPSGNPARGQLTYSELIYKAWAYIFV
jgi:hypothetical protein